MKASLEITSEQEDWIHAAMNAGNLSELYLTVGEISQAVASARQSVDLADRSGDGFSRMVFRVRFADSLHQAGTLDEPEKLFREAEAMQEQRQPDFKYLYSKQCFEFCDLLLSQRQHQEVQKRARFGLGLKTTTPLTDFGLNNVSLGRAFLLQALAEDTDPALRPSAFSQARDYLQQALAGLRESGNQDDLPRGSLASAACYRVQKEFALAWTNLDQTREIAERGEMKLFLADCHLEACRLCLAQYAAVVISGVETSRRDVSTTRRDVSTVAISTPVDSTTNHLSNARQHLATAEKMIKQMGYGRRKPEVEALQRELEAL